VELPRRDLLPAPGRWAEEQGAAWVSQPHPVFLGSMPARPALCGWLPAPPGNSALGPLLSQSITGPARRAHWGAGCRAPRVAWPSVLPGAGARLLPVATRVALPVARWCVGDDPNDPPVMPAAKGSAAPWRCARHLPARPPRAPRRSLAFPACGGHRLAWGLRRSQPHWKPSREQAPARRHARGHCSPGRRRCGSARCILMRPCQGRPAVAQVEAARRTDPPRPDPQRMGTPSSGARAWPRCSAWGLELDPSAPLALGLGLRLEQSEGSQREWEVEHTAGVHSLAESSLWACSLC